MRGGEPPTAEDIAASIIERLDADDDGSIVEEEASARMWSRLSAADADENGAVTSEELNAHIRSRLDGGGERPGRTFGGRGGFRGGRHGGGPPGGGFDRGQSVEAGSRAFLSDPTTTMTAC